MTRKNFCLYPFAAFSLDNGGHPRICCNNDAWVRVGQNKPFGDPTFNILKDYNNPLHVELRKFIIEDQRHESCKKCWEVEDEGARSYRHWFNESFNILGKDEEYWIKKCEPNGIITDIEYLYLDITFGNKCNLKCVMCNGANSTLFAKEQYEYGEIHKEHYEKMMSFDWFNDASQFEKLYPYINQVQRIHILGGEPLLIEHSYFLQKFIDLGISKDIIISYNSNLTTLPDEILDLWKEFKQVYLCVSVDAYKELNEFIRYPMKWAKLERNIARLAELNQENIFIQIHTTFSALNYLDLPDLLEWIKQLSLKYKHIDPVPFINYVYAPVWFDPVHLPFETKQQGFNKYINWQSKNMSLTNHDRYDMLKSHYLKVLNTEATKEIHRKFLERKRFFEVVRGVNCPKVLVDTPQK